MIFCEIVRVVGSGTKTGIQIFGYDPTLKRSPPKRLVSRGVQKICGRKFPETFQKFASLNAESFSGKVLVLTRKLTERPTGGA